VYSSILFVPFLRVQFTGIQCGIAPYLLRSVSASYLPDNLCYDMAPYQALYLACSIPTVLIFTILVLRLAAVGHISRLDYMWWLVPWGTVDRRSANADFMRKQTSLYDQFNVVSSFLIMGCSTFLIGEPKYLSCILVANSMLHVVAMLTFLPFQWQRLNMFLTGLHFAVLLGNICGLILVFGGDHANTTSAFLWGALPAIAVGGLAPFFTVTGLKKAPCPQHRGCRGCC